MAVSGKDDNAASTIIGVSSTDGVTPVRARVDPVTGYVLMSIKSVSYSPTGQKTTIDENDVPITRAVTNDASQTVKPLISDPNNSGYVLADVVQI